MLRPQCVKRGSVPRQLYDIIRSHLSCLQMYEMCDVEKSKPTFVAITAPVNELGPLGAGIYSYCDDSLWWQVNELQLKVSKNKSLFNTFWFLFLMMG